MLKQLNPPMPLVTPKGPGLAHFVIDYGVEHHLHWVVFLDKNGECWTFQNPDIRAQKNITQGREHISPFYDPKDVASIQTKKRSNFSLCLKCIEELRKPIESGECFTLCENCTMDDVVDYLELYLKDWGAPSTEEF